MTSSPLQLLLSAALPYALVSPRELTQCLKIETPQSSTLNAAKPTRRGIALRLGEWTEIKKFINDEFPTLSTTLPCFYGEDHQYTLIALQHRECYPFMNWSAELEYKLKLVLYAFPNKDFVACVMKHVRICHLVTVHFIDNHAEERGGPGMLVAIDRRSF